MTDTPQGNAETTDNAGKSGGESDGAASAAAAPEKKKFGGRPKGSKNKTTLQREREEELRKERERIMGVERANEARAAVASGKKLMKDMGIEFAQLFAGIAAYHQPYPQWVRDPATGKLVNANPNYDEARFKEYAMLAAETAKNFAPYESPRLSAVMVGQSVVTKIEVEGGMPDDFQAPPAQVFAPGTVISAEDFVDITPEPARPKVVNG